MKTVALIALAGMAFGAIVPKDAVCLQRTSAKLSFLSRCTLLARLGQISANNIQKRGLPTTDIQIQGLTYGGSGCPSNSVGSSISEDKTVVTLIFDQYIAAVGPGVLVTESRKNCQLNLKLKYPGGYQYSIMSADYRGFAALDAGVTGQQRSTYYFSGQTAQVSASSCIAVMTTTRRSSIPAHVTLICHWASHTHHNASLAFRHLVYSHTPTSRLACLY